MCYFCCTRKTNRQIERFCSIYFLFLMFLFSFCYISVLGSPIFAISVSADALLGLRKNEPLNNWESYGNFGPQIPGYQMSYTLGLCARLTVRALWSWQANICSTISRKYCLFAQNIFSHIKFKIPKSRSVWQIVWGQLFHLIFLIILLKKKSPGPKNMLYRRVSISATICAKN